MLETRGELGEKESETKMTTLAAADDDEKKTPLPHPFLSLLILNHSGTTATA